MVERKDIIPILSNIGILIDDQMETFDVDLTEYILDSIQFVSFIVELERELNIEFPDELLLYDNIRSLNGFISLIEHL
ncbi:MAG: acyl carrier protein [Clostridiales bacterium]|nr:acyl carrier protein [Clostridiales bacterium]